MKAKERIRVLRTSSTANRRRLSCETLEPRQMLTGTPAGDANFDNQFDQDDITLVLESGKYETAEEASFRQGDWNGDGAFDSIDIVLALQEGNYAQGQIDLEPAPPKNVILIIGDGMGFEHVKAAHMFQGEDLSFEEFPFQTEVVTINADAESNLLDSASTGTGIATGVKVNKTVVSQAIPGDGSDLTTILEVFKDAGKSTGLVTTSYITDATPAVFGAHEPTRANSAEIAADYFRDSRPNVLFGADNAELAPQAVDAGYTLVTDVNAMESVATESHSAESHVFGGFANYNNLAFQDTVYDWEAMAIEADELVAQLTGQPLPFADLGNPHLSEMAVAALNILGQNEDGFFLMVESSQIDQQSHGASLNDWGVGTFLPRSVAEVVTGISVVNMETVELSNTVKRVLEWVESHDILGETLILVTADHETSGLVVTADNGPGQHPDVEYTSGFDDFGFAKSWRHTNANVPLYAIGRNGTLFGADSDLGKPVIDNTEIYDRVLQSQSNFSGEGGEGDNAPD